MQENIFIIAKCVYDKLLGSESELYKQVVIKDFMECMAGDFAKKEEEFNIADI